MGSQYENNGQVIGGRRRYRDNAGPGPYITSADTLEGDSVVNSEGEHLGDLKAIMLDVPAGRIAYGVLSFGGLLGMGEKLFAIPWTALRLDAYEKRFVLDVDKEVLKNASGFDPDYWPEMADLQWATDVHDFYNLSPYWE